MAVHHFFNSHKYRELIFKNTGSLPIRSRPTIIPQFFILLLIIGLYTCNQNEPPQRSDEVSFVIATTIFPLEDWCRNIVPEGTEVFSLIPVSQNPHTYEPSISDAKRLSRTDLVVRIGYGYDDWIERLVRSTRGTDSPLLILSKTETEMTYIPSVSEEEHGEHEDHEHHSHAVNTHYWLDPIWAQDAVRMIAERIKTLRPDQAEEIESRTQDYLLRLAELHQEIVAVIYTLQYKSYIGYHGAFAHFADRYGLEELAAIELWSGKEPSLDHSKRIIDILRNMQNPVIFIEPKLNKKTAQVFADEVNCQVLILDPIGDPNVPGRDTYIDLMRYNLKSLQQGLSGHETRDTKTRDSQ